METASGAVRTTDVYDSFWWFAAERQRIYLRRLAGGDAPWTDDPVLSTYRFTNTYRASDRVSQYLIAEVQRGAHRSQAPAEVAFRSLLFKLFNKIETWELLESQLGPISWQSARRDAFARILAVARANGAAVYSAAYIMPSPAFGSSIKHENHLSLLWRMMEDGVPGQLMASRSLEEIYKLLLGYPGMGRFLACQLTFDLNYSDLLDHSEEGFVVAGPGAVDGIAKCFREVGDKSHEWIIHWLADRQDAEFAARGISFESLFGRRLQPIDLQNCLCETSKLARVKHPGEAGSAGRVRIKQSYTPTGRPIPPPVFPQRWGIRPPAHLGRHDPSPRLF